MCKCFGCCKVHFKGLVIINLFANKLALSGGLWL